MIKARPLAQPNRMAVCILSQQYSSKTIIRKVYLHITILSYPHAQRTKHYRPEASQERRNGEREDHHRTLESELEAVAMLDQGVLDSYRVEVIFILVWQDHSLLCSEDYRNQSEDDGCVK